MFRNCLHYIFSFVYFVPIKRNNIQKMEQISKNDFPISISTQDLEFIRTHKLFRLIASKIPSTRSQGKACISTKYVSKVLAGKVTSDSQVTNQIKRYAKELINQLK